MIYALPLYHPLRMVEEICMLDQMSGGRLDVGFGRGVSPIELDLTASIPTIVERSTTKRLRSCVQGLTSERSASRASIYDFDDVPMELDPLQKPHPPMWYGVNTAEGAETAGMQGFNFVANALTTQVRGLTDRYWEARKAAHPDTAETPLLGLGRFVILGETDEQALTIARRAYPRWHAHFHHLYHQRGEAAVYGAPRRRISTRSRMAAAASAGSPTTVARMIKDQTRESGTNYFVGQFAFGDLTLAEVLRTIELFVREVMPSLRGV